MRSIITKKTRSASEEQKLLKENNNNNLVEPSSEDDQERQNQRKALEVHKCVVCIKQQQFFRIIFNLENTFSSWEKSILLLSKRSVNSQKTGHKNFPIKHKRKILGNKNIIFKKAVAF